MVRSVAALRLPLRNGAGPAHREHGALRVRQYGGPADRGVEGRNHDLAAEPRGIVGGRIYVADPEVDVPARRRFLGGALAACRHHHSDYLAGDRLLGFAAYVAGDAPQRDLALTYIERVGLPAEHRVVERPGAPGVAGAELADGPGTRLVDELGTPGLTRLPAPEYRPRWIRDDRHAGGIEEVERLQDHTSTRVDYPG